MNLREILNSLLLKYTDYKTCYVNNNQQLIAKPSLGHFSDYVYLTVKQFDELQGGSCYDYTRKISNELNKLNIDNSSFFIASFNNSGELVNSYSFNIASDSDKVFCIDAFNKNHSLTSHSDEASAISYMVHSLGELDDYSIIKYDPEIDAPDYNNSLEEFCLSLAKHDNYLTLPK